MKQAIPIIGAVFSLVLLGGVVAIPAHADPNPYSICDPLPAEFCLNNWNGADGYVKAYTFTGTINSDFHVQGMPRCGNGDLTTANCPVRGVPAGLFMYQITYGDGSGYCIATDTSTGYALAGTCNNPNGYGGSYGTIQIAYGGGCPQAFNLGINNYWTGRNGGWSNAVGISYADRDGAQVILNGYGPNCLDYTPF